jgi:PAS domain S-box-containing protein
MEGTRILRANFGLLREHADVKQLLKVLGIVLAIMNLTLLGFKNFFFYHMFIEIFGICIAYSIFIIAINTYGTTKNNFVMFLGIAFFIVGTLDFLHLMTWEGLILFGKLNVVNISMQLWICARFIQAISMLLCCLIICKSIKIKIPVIIISVLAIFLIGAIFAWGIFPRCYIKRYGITAFSIDSEFLISSFLFVAMIILIFSRNRLNNTVVWNLVLSILCNISSELSFTLQLSSINISNILSHLFKLISFYLLYKAIIQTSLKAPYKLLINKLSNTENELQLNKIELTHVTEKLSFENVERKKMEESLLNNDDCYDMLIENSTDTIFIYSEGKIIFVNSRAIKLMKLQNKHELVGRAVIDFAHPLYVSKVNDAIKRGYTEKKGSRILRTVMLASDGEPMYVEVRSTNFMYKSKPAVLNVIRDLTSEKQVEELKENVKKSSNLLKETLEHNRLLNEFTANLAHEFRTPLNVMLGAIQILHLYDDAVNNEKREKFDRYLSTLKQNTYRLLRLVNNIVDISKIEAGFLELHLENHDIIGVVENITLSVVPYVEGKGINLTFDTDTEEKIMAFDPDKMERIILNLLSNAAKFTEAGDEIFVKIEDRQNSIIIKVSDTGSGISEDKISEVFKRFRQADNSLIKNSQGSGIGLSLVKSLVEMHGGTIAVHSKLGNGTEFIVELPVKQIPQCSTNQEVNISQPNIERISIEFSDIYS